jgi:hypothetical protein
LQHSCSYSPFLDFTKDSDIALSFALSNSGSINDFNNEESSIYQLFLTSGKDEIVTVNSKEALRSLLNSFSVYCLKTKIVLGSAPLFATYDTQGNLGIPYMKYTFSSFASIVNALTPKVLFIDVPTNDRMKFQKGTFVLFYDFLMVDQHIFYNLNPSFYIEKMVIPPNVKTSMLRSLEKNHPYCQQRYLMDPYDFFRDGEPYL